MNTDQAVQIFESLIDDLAKSNFITPQQFGAVMTAWQVLKPDDPVEADAPPDEYVPAKVIKQPVPGR